MKIPLLIILVLLITGVIIMFGNQDKNSSFSQKTIPPQNAYTTPTDFPVTSLVAEGLDTPWSLVFLNDNSILVTERPGQVRLINAQGKLEQLPIGTLSQVKEIGEGGLLGIEKDPDFNTTHYIYLYYTYKGPTLHQSVILNEGYTLNRVSRFTYVNNSLSSEEILVDEIPGNSNHNGGRIKFGPNGFLYITTGDAENPSTAQNKDRLGGKILRVTKDGTAVPGNPFNSQVYSYGHRNSQGITWDNENNLWETEHGRSFPTSGLDEINLIKPGNNYGWPIIQGDETKTGMITPVKNSGGDTWAPSGVTFLNGSLYFGGLRGQTLYEYKISNKELTEHLKGEFGRIRDVVVGPDGMLYITTSNEDGRGVSSSSGDKIIRVNPNKF